MTHAERIKRDARKARHNARKLKAKAIAKEAKANRKKALADIKILCSSIQKNSTRCAKSNDACNGLSTRSFSLPKKAIKMFGKPMVYVMRSDEGVLYVGSSAHGIGRPFQQAHSVPTKLLKHIDLHFCKTHGDALNLEALLIRRYSPPFNKVLPKYRNA